MQAIENETALHCSLTCLKGVILLLV